MPESLLGLQVLERAPLAGRVVHRLWRWLPVLVWMGLIFFLSSRPNLPHYPEPLVDVLLKKAGHVTEYGVLAMLVLRAVGRRPEWALLVAFLYALSDELHQYFVAGRTASWIDVGLDLAGAVLGVIAILRLRRRE